MANNAENWEKHSEGATPTRRMYKAIMWQAAHPHKPGSVHRLDMMENKIDVEHAICEANVRICHLLRMVLRIRIGVSLTLSHPKFKLQQMLLDNA
jgi:hypothetical protein